MERSSPPASFSRFDKLDHASTTSSSSRMLPADCHRHPTALRDGNAIGVGAGPAGLGGRRSIERHFGSSSAPRQGASMQPSAPHASAGNVPVTPASPVFCAHWKFRKSYASIPPMKHPLIATVLLVCILASTPVLCPKAKAQKNRPPPPPIPRLVADRILLPAIKENEFVGLVGRCRQGWQDRPAVKVTVQGRLRTRASPTPTPSSISGRYRKRSPPSVSCASSIKAKPASATRSANTSKGSRNPGTGSPSRSSCHIRAASRNSNKSCRRLREMLVAAQTLPLSFPPGTKQEYNNFNFAITGKLIEGHQRHEVSRTT